MIAVDTSTLIAYLKGEKGNDIDELDTCLASHIIALPPLVITEIISDPKLPVKIIDNLLKIPLLELKQGFWERAGLTRAKIISKSLKCRVADSIIAQCCIDHDIALITRDKDFRHFEKHTGLKVIW